MNTVIETMGGREWDFLYPSAKDVHLNDIVVGLKNTCRFAGLIGRYYSVLEHALLVRRLTYDMGVEPDVQLAALHHDSHEAYMGDVATPLKRALGDAWKEAEGRADAAIAEWLGVDAELFKHPAVKRADVCALYLEASILKDSQGDESRNPRWDWCGMLGGDWRPSWPEGWEVGTATPVDFYIAHHDDIAALRGSTA